MDTKYVPAAGNIFGSMLATRYIFAILSSIGMGIIYGLKVNMSVTMVAMLNHTAIAGGNQTVDPKKSTMEDGPFTWNEPLQGILLSCYFWGYMVAQIPGAFLAEMYSAKWVIFFSVFFNVVCTILTPISANIHYGGVIAMRVIEGLAAGVTFPAMHIMLSKWAPPTERSTISAIVYSGTSLGTVLSMLLSGIFAAAYGWESAFYFVGGISSFWCVAWAWFVADDPQKQRFISQEERSMIVSSLEGQGREQGETKPSIPWIDVFTSPPFLAILVAHICSNSGFYMLLLELPFYMKQIHHFNLKENSVVTALPYLTMWIFSLVIGRLLDSLRTTEKISTGGARKIATFISSAGPMCCLIILCFVEDNRSVAVLLMTFSVTCVGAIFCGFLSNHIDLAPNYAGILIALTNTVATIPGIIMPIFVGHITHGNQTIEAWRIVFFITIAFYIVEIVVYSIFASGEVQPWNKGSQRRRTAE